MPRNFPAAIALLSFGLALPGCGLLPTVAPTPQEQAVVNALSDVTAAVQEAFNQTVADVPQDVANDPAFGLLALAEPPTATTAGGMYAGPYPDAGALPAGYQVRPAGGWLRMNPAQRNTGEGMSVTSTYWTPGGTDQASAAQTVVAEYGGTTLQDLYVSPNTVVSDVPAYFKDKLTLPAAYQVMQAAETYATYNNGALKGTSTGYRWLVLDGDKQSWIRAMHVKRAGDAMANHYNVSSNYATLDGMLQPMHIAYGTQFEDSGVGYAFARDTELGTGLTKAHGLWEDTKTEAKLTIDETVDPKGRCQRVMKRTLNFGEVLTVEENYAPHGRSGSGRVLVNFVEIGTLSWDGKFDGEIRIGQAAAKYTATKKSASQRPTAMGIQMRVALPSGWGGTFGTIRHRRE